MPPQAGRRRRVAAVLKIELTAGQATPAPPVGTALGPHAVNIMDFCKQYNAATQAQGGTSSRWRSPSTRTAASASC